MLILVGIIAIVAVSGSDGQEQCTTSWGTRGSCVNVIECGPILIILRKSGPLKDHERNALATSQCGVVGDVPKVCCPHDGQIRPVTPAAPTVPDGPPDVTNHPNLRLVNSDQCGKSSDMRVYGGNKTKVLEFPWMALIGYTVGVSKDIKFRCGGTMISNRYVLTAAHCVIELGSGVRLARVRVGDHDTSKERDCDYEKNVELVCGDKYQDFSIERAHYLSQYSRPSQGSDIALIRVDRDIDFGRNNVKPICLPVGGAATLKSNNAIVTGWGLNETRQYSEALLKVRLPIVPLAECARIYKARGVDVMRNQMCAGGENGKDSCTGDSGGPLQSPDDSNGIPQYVQYGVVSYGPDPCGIAGIPGVYTQVAYYMDWILNTIQD